MELICSTSQTKGLEGEMTNKLPFRITDKREPAVPLDLQVYDAYPSLLAALVKWAQVVGQFPLDEMAAANKRIEDTSAVVVPGQDAVPVDLEILDHHRRLIDGARAFREVCLELDATAGAASEPG